MKKFLRKNYQVSVRGVSRTGVELYSENSSTLVTKFFMCRNAYLIVCLIGFIELRKLHDDVRQRGLSWFNGFRSEIKSEILRTVGFPPSTETNWEELDDGPAWTWWLLSLLPLGQNVHVS